MRSSIWLRWNLPTAPAMPAASALRAMISRVAKGASAIIRRACAGLAQTRGQFEAAAVGQIDVDEQRRRNADPARHGRAPARRFRP